MLYLLALADLRIKICAGRFSEGSVFLPALGGKKADEIHVEIGDCTAHGGLVLNHEMPYHDGADLIAVKGGAIAEPDIQPVAYP